MPRDLVPCSLGILLHHERGAEIDSHDVVIRFNSAPTKGLEAYVGRKTTHRITNTQNWAFRESEKEQLLAGERDLLEPFSVLLFNTAAVDVCEPVVVLRCIAKPKKANKR